MKRTTISKLLVLAAAMLLAPLAHADEEDGQRDWSWREKRQRAAKAYNKALYTRQRFDQVDTNGDGYLDTDELAAAQKDVEQPFDSERFQMADKDGDGQLSLDEAKAQKAFEKSHRRAAYKKVRDHVRDRGEDDGARGSESITTGAGERTDNGWQWEATTEGSTDSGRTWTTDHQGSRVKNGDGAISVERDSVTTLGNGKQITSDFDRQITKTDDGRTWETEAQRTGPRGTSTMSGSGEAHRTDSGVEWTADREGTNARGKSWTSSTTGEGQRTDDGREWSSTTEGQGAGGHEWTTDREGSAVKNGDGTVSVSRDATKTLDNGRTITTSKETTVSKSKNGRSWETETSREVTGGPDRSDRTRREDALAKFKERASGGNSDRASKLRDQAKRRTSDSRREASKKKYASKAKSRNSKSRQRASRSKRTARRG